MKGSRMAVIAARPLFTVQSATSAYFGHRRLLEQQSTIRARRQTAEAQYPQDIISDYLAISLSYLNPAVY